MKQILTHAQTVGLVERYRTVGDKQALTQLVRGYRWLVALIARKLMGRGLDLSDLMQEGYFGLIRAVEKFDPSRGVEFQTYAKHWIRRKMIDGIAAKGTGRPFSLTRYQEEQYRLIRRRAQMFETIYGKQAQPDELLTWIQKQKTTVLARKLTLKVTREMLFLISGFAVSKDALDERHGAQMQLETEMTEAAVSHPRWSHQEINDATEKREALWSKVKSLCTDKRERRILSLRFQKGWTLEKTGRRLQGLSKQRVWQIEQRILKNTGLATGMKPRLVQLILASET